MLAQGLNYALIESHFRKCAAEIHGDAVVDAHRTHFYGPSPITGFMADIVRWKPQTQPAR